MPRFTPLLSRAAVVLLAALILVAGRPAAAQTSDQQALVEKARLTVETLRANPDFDDLDRFIKRARAVLVIPELIKGGFIVGAEGGAGVLLARADDGSWSPPAFYTLAAGSVGLQIGGQVSEVVFTIMNQGALEKILENEFKLGGDASIAVGPIGKGVEASTTANLDADVYAFAKAKGLFGGAAFEGALIDSKDSYNKAYYGRAVSPQQIVIERTVEAAGAAGLRQALK